MLVTVLISTFDREMLLRKCIRSIVECDYKEVSIFIVVDGNRKLFSNLLGEPATMLLNDKRMDYVFSMNRALREMGDTDAVLYASDDLAFDPMCITEAATMLRARFPDGDGLIGLNTLGTSIQSAFGLMGKKFIDRFPDRQVFCPDYIHFASDNEVGDFARLEHRFCFCPKAIIRHTKLRDTTTELGLAVKRLDRAAWRHRRNKGLCWGVNFTRIGKPAEDQKHE